MFTTWLGRVAQWGLAGAIVLAAVVIHLAGDRFVFLRNLEAESLDLKFRLRGSLAPGPETVMVLIDDRTFLKLGRLPIERRYIAQGIDMVARDGARVISLDLLLTERQDDAVDRELAEVIANAGSVVLPFAFVVEPNRNGTAPTPTALLRHALRQDRIVDESDPRFVVEPADLLLPLPELMAGAATMAHVNVMPSGDASLRFEYPVLRYQGAYFPSFPLAVTHRYLQLGPATPLYKLDEHIEFGRRTVPLDGAARMLVNYYGPPGSFPTYSFINVLEGRPPPGLFRDKIVLLGAAAIGAKDSHRAPFGQITPNLERYATLIDNAQSERYLSRPDWVGIVNLLLIVILGSTTALITIKVGARRAGFVSLLLAGGFLTANYHAFAQLGLWIAAVEPTAVIFAQYVTLASVRVIREETARSVAEKALRRSRERYALAARGANDGLWDWNLDSGRANYSGRWRQMMGMPPAAADFDRSTWLSRIHPDDRATFEIALANHLDGLSPQFQHEFRVIQPDGTLSYMLSRGMAVRDAKGHPRRIAGSLTDISELKRRATELAAMADRLTIAHRDAEEGRIEAETDSRAKLEFLALISHELRTPLNAILGFTDVMNRQIFGPIENARYRGYLGDIQSSGEHLLQLINSILDYSKAAAGRLELVDGDVDTNATANACVRLLKAQATAREIAITLVMPPGPLWLHADETRLKQMILNLLSNGIKFTEKGGAVRVTVAVDRAGGQTIQVKDTGIGMSADAASYVFEPFRQVQGQHVRAHEGTGLGLPITKHLIELHGGRVELVTELGAGTTVTLHFPPDRTVEPPAQRAAG